jgi:hypothetical protein
MLNKLSRALARFRQNQIYSVMELLLVVLSQAFLVHLDITKSSIELIPRNLQKTMQRIF